MAEARRPRPDRTLASASVAIVGVGGLGAAAAAQLSSAGIGRLTLIDDDRVELSNLPRQLLYRDADIGLPKAEVAARHLRRQFPDTSFRAVAERVTRQNSASLLKGASFVIEATDNVASKLELNDSLVRLGIPFSHAGVAGFRGQLLTVLPRLTACVRCVFPGSGDSDEPDCQRSGIIGPLPALLGIAQAVEAIKVLSGVGEPLTDRLTIRDQLGGWRTVRVERDPACEACAPGATAR